MPGDGQASSSQSGKATLQGISIHLIRELSPIFAEKTPHFQYENSQCQRGKSADSKGVRGTSRTSLGYNIPDAVCALHDAQPGAF